MRAFSALDRDSSGKITRDEVEVGDLGFRDCCSFLGCDSFGSFLLTPTEGHDMLRLMPV